eukprot:jgi/Mesvir1/28422/Mv15850-RA.1
MRLLKRRFSHFGGRGGSIAANWGRQFHLTAVRAEAASAAEVARAGSGNADAAEKPHAHHHGPQWKASIDFKSIRDNLELHKRNCKLRRTAGDPVAVVALYESYVAKAQETDALRNERNNVAAKMKGKLDEATRAELIEKGRLIKEKLADYEAELVVLENQMQYAGQMLPNLTHPDVPVGSEDQAVLRKMVGAKRDFTFTPRDHTVLGEILDCFNFARAAQVSGNKFYYLQRDAAMLELALVTLAMQRAASRGFMTVMTPDLVRDTTVEKCGFQPRMANTQVYSIMDSDLCLTGTAEIPLGGMYMDEIIPEADLPIKLAAFGHCFRTEAGAAGASTRGLYRVHQFSKVEMFVLCTPAQSEALHEELISFEEELYAELGLHFKSIDMPTEDLGAPAYRKFDIEAWMPGLGRYGEISSASNCTDYQSRRLNIRYRQSPPADDPADASTAEDAKSGKKGPAKAKKPKPAPTAFVHTLNATAVAVPRMLIALLENFQNEDGSVDLPPILHPYMGGKTRLLPYAKSSA